MQHCLPCIFLLIFGEIMVLFIKHRYMGNKLWIKKERLSSIKCLSFDIWRLIMDLLYLDGIIY